MYGSVKGTLRHRCAEITAPTLCRDHRSGEEFTLFEVKLGYNIQASPRLNRECLQFENLPKTHTPVPPNAWAIVIKLQMILISDGSAIALDFPGPAPAVQVFLSPKYTPSKTKKCSHLSSAKVREEKGWYYNGYDVSRHRVRAPPQTGPRRMKKL